MAIALGLLFAGIALVPYVALPSERFGWQLFAGVYGDGPHLAVNYDAGAPGSSFTVTGFNFPANRTVVIKANGHVLGTIVSDDIGGFQIRIATDANTDEGFYEIEAAADGPSPNALSALSAAATVRFRVSTSAPLRAAEGAAPTFALPDGIAVDLIFTPFVRR